MESTGSKVLKSHSALPVLGLDISLTSTGVSNGVASDAIQAGPLRGEARMDHITSEIKTWIHPGVRLAVVEGPSFNSLGPGHDELAGLRWHVRHMLWRLGVPVAVVAPTSLKKYTTGSGAATKSDMVAFVAEKWGIDFSDIKVGRGRHDMADAYALARMGEDFLAGKPYVGVQWPEVTL